MSENNETQKKGKSSTAIIAFLLGFLFAIIALIGALFGVGLVVYNSDVDKILDMVGLDNSDDLYVNNPEDNMTVKELVGLVKDKLLSEEITNDDGTVTYNYKASEAVSSFTSKKLEDVYAIFPIIKDKLLDELVYGFIDDYIDAEGLEGLEEAIEHSAFTELIGEVSDAVMNINTYALAEKLGLNNDGDGVNLLLKAMTTGGEADYATVKKGGSVAYAEVEEEDKKPGISGLPVLFDEYEYKEFGLYTRINGDKVGQRYPSDSGLSESLLVSTSKSDNQEIFRLYYVPCRVTAGDILEPEYEIVTEEYKITKYINGAPVEVPLKIKILEFAKNTDFIAVEPDSSGKFVLDHSSIINAYSEQYKNDPSRRFYGYSYRKDYARNYYTITPEKDEAERIIDYKQEIYSALNYYRTSTGDVVFFKQRKLKDLLDQSEENSELTKPLYSVSVASIFGQEDDMVYKIFGNTSLGALIDGAVDTKDRIDRVELSAFMSTVDPGDKIMANIVYKLSDMQPVEDANGNISSYTAKYDDNGTLVPVTVTLKQKDSSSPYYIDKVYREGSTVPEKGATVSSISSLSSNMTINVVLDITIDKAVMMYMGYGITGVYKSEGDIGDPDDRVFHYDYIGNYNSITARGANISSPCYISVKPGTNVVDKAYEVVFDVETNSYEFYELPVTTVNKMSDRVDVIMDYLTLPDFMDIDPTDAITTFVGYRIANLAKVEGNPEYDYVGTYCTGEKLGDEEITYPCYVKAGELPHAYGEAVKYKIANAWYYDEMNSLMRILGTTVKEVNNAIDGMKDHVTLGNIIDIDRDDPQTSQILKSLADTPINGMNSKINSMTVDEIFTASEIDASPVLRQLRGVKVTALASAIDNTLIQRTYSKEVYGLPADGDPMEVIRFVGGLQYYITEKQPDNTYQLTPVTLNAESDMQTDLVYLTYGLTPAQEAALTAEELAATPLKIIAYNSANGYNRRWLYYTIKQPEDGGDVTKPVYELIHGDADDDVKGNFTDAEAVGGFEAGKYYTYGEAHGMWRLILFKKVSLDDNPATTEFVEKAYTISNFSNMVAVCSNNVYQATLKELKEADIIKGVSDAELAKTLSWYENGVLHSKALKDMTLQELIAAVIKLAA